MKNGRITDATRLERTLPTIEYLTQKGAKVVVISHFGRPDGSYDPKLSLAPIADEMTKIMDNRYVHFGVDTVGNAARKAVEKIHYGEVILLENLRFHAEEEENNHEFAKELASLADIYVNEAFACSHRAHASIEAITHYLPSYAGFLLSGEIEKLEKIFAGEAKPLAAIIGGSKISSKIILLENMLRKVDYLIIGGAMANTFLLAQGYEIGKSLVEKEHIETAKKVLSLAKENKCEIILPKDALCANSIDAAEAMICDIAAVNSSQMILDIGALSVLEIAAILQKCHSVIWNGPVGAFEYPLFSVSSSMIARMIAGLSGAGVLNSVAGGGDTLAAINYAGVSSQFSYISTAGGAFLEWLEGRDLPGVRVLK